MTRQNRRALAIAATLAVCVGIDGHGHAQSGLVAGLPGVGWMKVSFMYTNRPRSPDAWLVPLLTRYGPRHAENALPGSPVIYAVLADRSRGSRIILAIGTGDKSCVSAGQGIGATLAPDTCPTHVIVAEKNGHVRASRLARGCFIWIEPDDPSINADGNAVYVRAIPHTRSIETRTLIAGRSVPGCAVSVPLD